MKAKKAYDFLNEGKEGMIISYEGKEGMLISYEGLNINFKFTSKPLGIELQSLLKVVYHDM